MFNNKGIINYIKIKIFISYQHIINIGNDLHGILLVIEGIIKSVWCLKYFCFKIVKFYIGLFSEDLSIYGDSKLDNSDKDLILC